MARTALFLLLFCVTNASLALLYPFSLARFLLETVIYGTGTGVMLYLLFYPRSQWLVANRSQVERDGCVALTFDDGPDPVDTPRLLDLLREKNVKQPSLSLASAPSSIRRSCAEPGKKAI